MLIIGTFLIRRFYPSAYNQESSNFGNYSIVSSQQTLASATNTLLAEQVTNDTTKAAKEVGGFFKTIIDQESGQYAIVNSNRTTVTLRDKNGKTIWLSEVMWAIPLDDQQSWGHEITYMEIVRNELYIFIGKAAYTIDKKTGKVTFVGSD